MCALVYTCVHTHPHTHALLSPNLELYPPWPIPAWPLKPIQTHLSHIWPCFLPFLLEVMLSSTTEHSLVLSECQGLPLLGAATECNLCAKSEILLERPMLATLCSSVGLCPVSVGVLFLHPCICLFVQQINVEKLSCAFPFSSWSGHRTTADLENYYKKYS